MLFRGGGLIEIEEALIENEGFQSNIESQGFSVIESRTKPSVRA